MSVASIESDVFLKLPASLLKKLLENSHRIPGYGLRKDWLPKSQEDFGDGGAYPEVFIPQFPCEMGKNTQYTQALIPVAYDSTGKFSYDAIVKYNRPEESIIHSKPADMIGRRYDDKELERDQEKISEVIKKTGEAVANRLDEFKKVRPTSSNPQLIKYTASSVKTASVPQRLIKIVEKLEDPLEPPKFQVHKNTESFKDPAVPILQVTQKKATKEEKELWNLPPALSNWNNKHGYTIDLDKRLANQSRGSQEIEISSGFAKFTAALDSAQILARERVEYRKTVEKQKLLLQREKEEQQARRIAELTRRERAGIRSEAREIETLEERNQRLARDAIREEYRLERIDMERKEKMGSKDRIKAQDRDISEKIALGQEVSQKQSSIFDPRLMDHSKGLDHGFVNDEDYNPYEKSLLNSGREMALYKVTGTEDVFGRNLDIDASSTFEGAQGTTTSGRSGPVKFERDEYEELTQKRDELERLKSLKQENEKQGKESDLFNEMFQAMANSKSNVKKERNENKRYGYMNVVAGSSSIMNAKGEDNIDSNYRHLSKRIKQDFVSER